MQDEDLFPKLAELYQLEQPVTGTRGPSRVSGFPGLITLFPARGNAIVIKQDNNSAMAIEKRCQRDVIFQQRCVALGLPAPRPIFARDGSHGSVFNPEAERLDQYKIFSAEEFVDGTGLLDASVDKKTALRVLDRAGSSAALLRIASRRFGNWELSSETNLPALRRLVTKARLLHIDWAEALESVAPALASAASVLPLDSKSDQAHVAPWDFHPKDAMYAEGTGVVFTDWERMSRAEWKTPLGWCNDAWMEWANEYGISTDHAATVIDRSFAQTMRRHPEPPSIPVESIAPEFPELLQKFVDESSLAVVPNLLPQWRADCEQTIRDLLPHLSAAAELISVETLRLDSQHLRTGPVLA